MTTVLADVGGTNTRMARAMDGKLDSASVRWFRNDDYSDFYAVLDAYGAQAEALCIAIAGPVTGRVARLTNRDWVIDSDAFGVPTRLINDLEAVGHALDILPADALSQISPGVPNPSAQRLVVGLGTGFNVSLVAGAEVLRAEFGHTTLPMAVAEWLADEIGQSPFPSVESLFSGKGLQHLHSLRTGTKLSAAQIVSQARDTLSTFGEALGLMNTQMVYTYLPMGGIFLNGGLARAVMQTREGEAGFARGYQMGDMLGEEFTSIPVHLVTDDAAALYGCASASG